jgi:hypothetical protein
VSDRNATLAANKLISDHIWTEVVTHLVQTSSSSDAPSSVSFRGPAYQGATKRKYSAADDDRDGVKMQPEHTAHCSSPTQAVRYEISWRAETICLVPSASTYLRPYFGPEAVKIINAHLSADCADCDTATADWRHRTGVVGRGRCCWDHHHHPYHHGPRGLGLACYLLFDIAHCALRAIRRGRNP